MEDLIKNLKHLRPDAAYARRSRALIVGGTDSFRGAPGGSTIRQAHGGELDRTTRLATGGFWSVILNSFEYGTAVALAGALLVLAVGGFSTWKFLSPFNLASLDPAGIKAEAQAVDIQIHLTDVNYAEGQGESTPSTVSPEKQPAVAAKQLAKNLGIEEESASGTTAFSIDETLEKLSE